MTKDSSKGRWRGSVSALCLCVAALGCRGSSPSDKGEAREGRPLDVPALPRTTDPAQALRQLDGGIDLRRRQLAPVAGQGPSPYKKYKLGGELVGMLLHRARFFGTVDDYLEAQTLATELATELGDRHPDLHIIAARALTSAHRFDDAMAALDRALANGKVEADVLTQRASIWLARGEPRKTWNALRERSKKRPAPGMVLLTAAALSDLGELDGAETEFRRALGRGHKGAAEPVAEVFFLWGRMWEREGQPGRAKKLYELARQRLPTYAALAAHYAALEFNAGNVSRALDLLEPVLARSQDPEIEGLLASLHRKAGDAGRADSHLAAARAGYEQVVVSQPLAFADHAARFYLDVGADPQRALALAKANLANRRSDEAYQLFLDAAFATKTPACETAGAAVDHPDASAYLLFAASRALKACGDAERAERALALAKKAPRAR